MPTGRRSSRTSMREFVGAKPDDPVPAFPGRLIPSYALARQVTTAGKGASDGPGQMLQRAPMSIDVSDPSFTRTTPGGRCLRSCAATIRCIIATRRRSAPIGRLRATTTSLRSNSTMRISRRVRNWAVYRSPISRRGRSVRASSGWIRRATPRSDAPSRRS